MAIYTRAIINQLRVKLEKLTDQDSILEELERELSEEALRQVYLVYTEMENRLHIEHNMQVEHNTENDT